MPNLLIVDGTCPEPYDPQTRARLLQGRAGARPPVRANEQFRLSNVLGEWWAPLAARCVV